MYYQARVLWPNGNVGAWTTFEASSTLEAAKKAWPSAHPYDTSKKGEPYLTIEVRDKEGALYLFRVKVQYHDRKPAPGFAGEWAVAYSVEKLNDCGGSR